MSRSDAILAIVIGYAAIVVAVFNKHFYARPAGVKEVPRWAGQLLFGLIGAMFIVFGLLPLWRDS